MKTPENDRSSREDRARRADEQERARSDEQMVSRGIAEPEYSDVPESARVKAPEAPSRERTGARPEQRADRSMPLFAGEDAAQYRQRWSDIQAGFVDEPRKAVQQADSLVADTMQRLAEEFAKARQQLEQQWDRGEGVTTEDLRVALQRYRAFFDRLLSV